MRIAVVSDTHGLLDKALQSLKIIDGLEMIIHLGDYVKDAKKIEERTGIKTVYVRGNCDYLELDIEEEKIIEIEDKKIFITHGHKYDVKNGINKIFYRGKELNVDAILFGHSHISMILEYEGILMLNPGSTEIPRGGSDGSIGIIDISNGDIKGKIKIV